MPINVTIPRLRRRFASLVGVGITEAIAARLTDEPEAGRISAALASASRSMTSPIAVLEAAVMGSLLAMACTTQPHASSVCRSSPQPTGSAGRIRKRCLGGD